MDKRMLLAIVLTIALIMLTNLLFPPSKQTGGGGARRPDTTAVATPGSVTTKPAAPAETARVPTAVPKQEQGAPAESAAARPSGEPVTVETPLLKLRFDTRGAVLRSADLRRYRSYAPGDSSNSPVRLIREGDGLLGFRVVFGADTLDLRDRIFVPSSRVLRLDSTSAGDSVSFRYAIGQSGLTFRATYHFRPDSYMIRVTGGLEGLTDRGYTVLTSLGHGLRSNEASPKEDYAKLAYVVNGVNGGVDSHKLSDLDAGEVRSPEGGPFTWVAVRNKYFLIAYVSLEDQAEFGGLVAKGMEREHAADLTVALPVPAGRAGLDFGAFMGPQDYGRLTAIGKQLTDVNPYGWRWLRPIIRPLVGLIMAVLTWLHDNLSLAYGWVLILFGVLMRVVLFPLYQKSMRAQMAQMQVQPLMKEIQEKHKDDPEKLQKEMMKLYKEHNINPLAGCLPMLLPWPVLITLFFVFENTIEFRGVPFLWLPDLSRPDPIYVIPIVMGLSMFLLQWIGQRGMERNTQMKLMGYGMPLLFTFLFLRFPAGLNLYYATSNLASLPQQFYLARERERMQES